MQIEAHLIKAFTKNAHEGNPAGVVRNADDLSDQRIIFLAQQLAFAESAFLQRSDVANYKLRLFSVVGEVKSCITATLAAAHEVFKSTRESRVVFETKLGNREVFRQQDGSYLVKQPSIEFIGVRSDHERIAELLNISEESFLDLPIELVSAGTPKLLIPVKTLDDLFAIQPNLSAIAQYCTEIGARGFYPFTFETKNLNANFHARQFNPLDGIAEDPVTGIAAVALAAYLQKHSILQADRLLGEQGHIIHKPGEIILENQEDVWYVGGHATDFGKRLIVL